MYIPRHWHQIFPVSVILLGFWLKQKLGDTFDVWLTMMCLQAAGLMHGWYIMQAGIIYQHYITAINTPDPKPVIIEAKPVMPPVKMGELQTINQVVELPSFNLERHFWEMVLRMYDHDPVTQRHVDLTETRWVINKKMFSQKPFANMKLKAEHFGLLKRKSAAKNARFIVDRREAVALVAAGNPLPDWTPPPHSG